MENKGHCTTASLMAKTWLFGKESKGLLAISWVMKPGERQWHAFCLCAEIRSPVLRS
jgi:hypothetical protein